MKILLPVDGSHYTKRMLSYIAAHDELLGRGHEYVVFHAIASIPAYPTRFLDRSVIDAYYLEQSEEVFRPVRAFADQQGWKIHFLYAHGQAAEEIATIGVAEKVDLIVMGTHGHSSLGTVLLGSVATGVLARCKLPVLLIR